MAVCLIVAVLDPAAAGDTEPERAGREGRAELDRLLAKQRQDRDIQAAQPQPTQPKPPKTPVPTGRKLPAICIGCGAN